MSFDDDERSVSANRPIDLFTITTPTAIYLHTSHPVDVTYAGNVHKAITMDRGTQQLGNDPGVDEQTLELPISHPLVQSYASTGIPELVISVTILRLQTRSGAAQQIFTGFAQSLTVDGHTAKIRVPAATADALKIQLPVVGATRLCNHRLFDGRCSPNPGLKWPASGPTGSGGPDPANFLVLDTVNSISADGLTLGVFAIGVKPSGWATFGRLIVPTTGDQRRIVSHVGTTLTIAVPFPGLTTSTGVRIEAGCDHSMATCKSKFNNQLNHGGHPLMPISFNAWAVNGLGVITQS